MNKFKVGQKVKIVRTGKIGEIKDIDSNDFTIYGCSNMCYQVEYNDIPTISWFSVYDLELIKEILNEKEKEYLGNVIKPFRDLVTYIEKSEWKNREYIKIDIKNEAIMFFPYFETNTMYKGMEVGKGYTLTELGLED